MRKMPNFKKLFIFVLLSTIMNLTFANDLNSLGQEVPAGALWNDDQTAAVLTLKRSKGTQVFVYVTQGEQMVKVDISQVEGMNLAKLGRYRLADYDRVESTPIEWIARDDGKFQINIQTRAWKNGKRQTVMEWVLIDDSAKMLWR